MWWTCGKNVIFKKIWQIFFFRQTDRQTDRQTLWFIGKSLFQKKCTFVWEIFWPLSSSHQPPAPVNGLCVPNVLAGVQKVVKEGLEMGRGARNLQSCGRAGCFVGHTFCLNKGSSLRLSLSYQRFRIRHGVLGMKICFLTKLAFFLTYNLASSFVSALVHSSWYKKH